MGNVQLNIEEIKMIKKGQKHWKNMNVLNENKGGYIDSSTIKNLINDVIDDVWRNAKEFYSNSTPKKSLKAFTLFWLSGKREVLYGKNLNNALTNAGYSQGALKALDFWAYGDNDNYVWNPDLNKWNSK